MGTGRGKRECQKDEGCWVLVLRISGEHDLRFSRSILGEEPTGGDACGGEKAFEGKRGAPAQTNFSKPRRLVNEQYGQHQGGSTKSKSLYSQKGIRGKKVKFKGGRLLYRWAWGWLGNFHWPS